MNKGQSLVEFGVSLLVLLFLLSGLVEFGIIFFQYVQLSDAAQEGALYASACDCSVAEIEERTRFASDSPINLRENTGVSVSVTAKDKSGNAVDPELVCEGGSVTVMLSYLHKIFMPFLPQLLGVTHINVKASVTDTVLSPICS